MKCDRLKLLEFVKLSWRIWLSIGEAAWSSFWSSSRSLGEFEYQLEKPLEETNWLAVVKRYVSVPCDPLKLVMSSRESWVFQDWKISAKNEAYCNLQLLVILQSGYGHLSTWAIRLQYDHILCRQLRVPFFYSGHHLQRSQGQVWKRNSCCWVSYHFLVELSECNQQRRQKCKIW